MKATLALRQATFTAMSHIRRSARLQAKSLLATEEMVVKQRINRSEKKTKPVSASSSRRSSRREYNKKIYKKRKQRYFNKLGPKMKICTSDFCDLRGIYQPRKNFPRNDSSVTGLHGRCNSCILKDVERKCSASVENFISRLYTNAESKAKQRNVLFNMSFEQWLERYHHQNGLCAITGLKMELPRENEREDQTGTIKAPMLISPDQKIAGAGYSAQNLQFVCNHVNRMKSDADQQDFIEMCHAVSDNQRKTKELN